jgi:hypothetical protein
MQTKTILTFIAAAFLVLTAPPMSSARDWTDQIHPYISVEQTYDDNIDLKPSENRKSDNITVVRPGLGFNNMDQTGGIAFDYNLGVNRYWKHDENNYISHNANLDMKYMTREHFNFHLKEIFVRSDEPREREYLAPSTVPNAYVISTVQERSVYWRNIVIPTVEYMFGKESKLGVSYTENDYDNEDQTIGKKREATVSPFFAFWLDERNGISGTYGYTHGDFENDPDLRGQNASLRYTYRYGPKSSVYLDNAVLRRDFKSSDSNDYDVYNPKIGIEHAFSRTLTGLIEGGYYWQDQEGGPTRSAPTYRAGLTNVDQRTTYNLTVQGGFYEDYFTSENLGFTRYHRVLFSVMHRLERRMFVSLMGNGEYADFIDDREDWVYGGAAAVGYDVFKWLTISLNYTFRERNSNIDSNDYTDNRVMFAIKAVY